MSDLKKGQLVYSASWGSRASKNQGHAFRATRPECLRAFLESGARKCFLSANECGGTWEQGVTLVFRLNVKQDHRVGYKEEFTRAQAQQALATLRFRDDVPTMLYDEAGKHLPPPLLPDRCPVCDGPQLGQHHHETV